MGHPGQIIEITLARQIGIGFSFVATKKARAAFLIVIPFFMISVEIMKKHRSMDWVSFNNMFNE